MQALTDLATQIEIDPDKARAFGWVEVDSLIRAYAIGERMAYQALVIASGLDGLLRQIASAVEGLFTEALDNASSVISWRSVANGWLQGVGACASYDEIKTWQRQCEKWTDDDHLDQGAFEFLSALGDCLDTILRVRRPYTIKGWDSPGECRYCWRLAPERKGQHWVCTEHDGPTQSSARKKQLRILQHFRSTDRPHHDEIGTRERRIRRALVAHGLFQIERLNAVDLDLVRALMPRAMGDDPDVMSAARRLDPHGAALYEQALRLRRSILIGDGAALYFLSRAEAWLSAEAERESNAVQRRRDSRGPRVRFPVGN